MPSQPPLLRAASQPAAVNLTAADLRLDNILSVINGGPLSAQATLAVLATFFGIATSVVAYGATGDGSTDDTVAIQAAIDATAAGGVVYFPPPSVEYKTTAALGVAKALTLLGQNSKIKQVTAAAHGIDVTAGNVFIRGLYLEGPTSASFETDSRAIYVTGTFHAGVAPTYIGNVSVQDCRIDQWNGFGVLVKYVDGFRGSGNYLTNLVYTGIGIISGKNGRIENNRIDTVTGTGVSQSNAYGIFLSRDTADSGELTSQPLTTDYAVTGNIIRNVPTWEGINSHGGQNIVISGNEIYNCQSAIFVSSSGNSADVPTYAPKVITITGNTVDSGVTDGSASYGILLVGSDAPDYATGCIVGNTIKGYGDQSNAISGAIHNYRTVGLSVTGNTIVNGSPNAINLYYANIGFTCIGNAIVDPWSNTLAVGEAVGIHVNGQTNTGTISGNTFSVNGFSATYLLTTGAPHQGIGIRIEDYVDNSIQLGPNESIATIYVYDPGAHSASTFPALTTSAPSGGTAAAWKLGSKAAGTVALDTTQYVQVEIAGVAYKLGIVV